ncbi:MAG: hypothetical protein JNK82_12810, partial [Myxococcaceae bacterium]|nr:hypothetical protein [Myxococcaceae bacterium]
VDGAVTARGERPAGELDGLMEDLLVRGKVIEPQVPLYKRPLFWVAIATGVIAAAAGTTVFFVTRPIITRGELQP